MSQLLSRLSKLSSRNNVLIHKSVRLFSTTSPYLTVGTKEVKEDLPEGCKLPDGCKIGEVLLFDPVKEEVVTVTDKLLPNVLLDQEMIGASHGWGVFSSPDDYIVCLTDLFSPVASKLRTRVIALPQLPGYHNSQTQVVNSVAMSSSPDHEDCVVAIKFSGPRLSLFRLGHEDLGWTYIGTPFQCLENSNVMYSQRDQRFYLAVPGASYLFSYDRYHNEGDKPLFHELVYRGHPELDQSEWELLSSCSRTEYLVDSPSTGERFLVKWYSQGYHSSRLNRICHKTIRFLVFREEETTQGKIMCYTDDIEDMCIFLSGGEAFCIPASSCQGLKPNTIYFMGRGLGSYDLNTGDVHNYCNAVPSDLTASYWLPPFSM